MHFVLNAAAVHWCLVVAHLCEYQILTGVNAGSQDCCQPFLHSRIEHQGMHFVLDPSAMHWCLVIAHLCEFHVALLQGIKVLLFHICIMANLDRM